MYDEKSPNIRLEETISEIITGYPNEVWPDLKWTIIERERRLSGGSVLDLRFRDRSGTDWIVELKRNRATVAAVTQIVRYLKSLRVAEPTVSFRGMVVAPAISSAGLAEVDRLGIAFRSVDDDLLRGVANFHGLSLEHASGHRPQLAGSPRVSSRPKTRTRNLPATSGKAPWHTIEDKIMSVRGPMPRGLWQIIQASNHDRGGV